MKTTIKAFASKAKKFLLGNAPVAPEVQFIFDHNQPHQLHAIESTVDLLEGFEKQTLAAQNRSSEFEFQVISNVADDDVLEDFEEELYDNYQRIRDINKERTSSFGAEDDLLTGVSFEQSLPLDGTKNCLYSVRYPRFTIEMETGTGKTYTYLRSIYELNARYGFVKFIIVVPSVAIFEGVKKSYQLMRSDFLSQYNENMIFIEYDGSKINQLKSFAEESTITVMLMTIQSFDKMSNNLYKPNEGFENALPYEYIQATRPILILDESQNYLTPNAKTALCTLNPLLALCYSATPKERPNLIYRLTPVDAFQRGLTKRIEVIGIEDLVETMDDKTLVLDTINKNPLTAVLKLSIRTGAHFNVESVAVKVGDDLAKKTKNDAYQAGYVVKQIKAKKGEESLVFDNGRELYLKESTAAMLKEELFRELIRETIKTHFTNQRHLITQGIKVLSLFFIDKVANYQPQDGIIRFIFEEEFARVQCEFKETHRGFFDHFGHLLDANPRTVHEGYFAKTMQTKNKAAEAVDDFSQIKAGERAKAEKQAYELIMKEKGRLLSLEEPVSFIFAHSALKEGWDNPNVFQICTLNQTKSEPKKRQEIGRGLRLCVDQQGNRVSDPEINILTIIANESYESYANRLQKDFEEDDDLKSAATLKPSHKDKSTAQRNNALFYSDAFQAFWHTLQQKADYEIQVNTDKLIEDAITLMNKTEFKEQKFKRSHGRFILSHVRLEVLRFDPTKEAATIKLELTNTERNQKEGGESIVTVGSVLSQRIKDDALKGFKVIEIDRDRQSIVFSNHRKLTLGEPPIEFDVQVNNDVNTSKAQTIGDHTKHKIPIMHFFDRVQKEVHLTRNTILAILKGMDQNKVEYLIKNPEGFIAEFSKKLKQLVAEHVAHHITFIKQDTSEDRIIDDIFPESTKYVQTEIINGNDKTSLYDKIQIDSEIERQFVETFLNADSKVFVFFKFPPKFKIQLPKILGNYNPDWGILRWYDKESRYELALCDYKQDSSNNSHLVQLVRETKGHSDISKLQFAHEGWKILCGQQYFKTLGIDYNVTDGKSHSWQDLS
ncbi:DEAD/DEAH box helicase family protein [Cysteiniphilum litorale]|uniref:restriction endonuclease n=1 Tax=Cysteiniphilum litorale TaxID=2056700 RepID=UPI003F882B0A